MSSSSIDNWEPVSDDMIDDSEVTLTHRKGALGNDVSSGISGGEMSREVAELNSSKCSSNERSTASSSGEENEGQCSKRNGSGDSNSNAADTVSYTDSVDSKKNNDKRRPSFLSSPSKSPGRRKSASSLDLSVSVNLKSTPADPHLSDVNSVSSTKALSQSKDTALNSVNNLISGTEKEFQPNGTFPKENGAAQTGSAPSFFDNMISSLSFKGAGPATNAAAKTQLIDNNKAASPPDIITHRRQTSINNKKMNNKKESSSDLPQSPLQQAEKPKEVLYNPLPSEDQPYDPKRFIDEKFLDTPFHYATSERNTEFHNLFNGIPKEDRLLDDFSCTLSREFLYQGRVYVSESNLCFHSSLLGWIAKVITPFKDVTYMEKTSTAGLFPNAISIETEGGKTQFNGFLSRDSAFTLIKEVWSRALLKLGENGSLKPLPSESSIDHHTLLVEAGINNRSINSIRRPSEPPSRASFISENDSIIEDAIRSVDDYTPSYSRRDSGVLTEDDSEDDQHKGIIDKDEVSSKIKAYKLRSDSKYEYDGPYCARETQFPFKPEDNNEYVLAEFECKAPPGLVFQLLFNDQNPSFWLEFFQSQDSSNFSDIGKFDKTDDEGKHYREFTYAKGLHFPVGPKSTKCAVRETILHLDYSDYIHVVNTTRTPDVPSGGSFSTKTRYLFRWGSETTCILKVSFFVEWTAGSWIKSMVESSCKSGQISATKDLVKQIQKFVEDNTVQSFVSSRSSSKKSQYKSKSSSKEPRTSQRKPSVDKTVSATAESITNRPSALSGETIVVPLLLIVSVLLLLNLYYQMGIKRDISKLASSPLFRAIKPESKGFYNYAQTLADIPARINAKEGQRKSEFWDLLQSKFLSNPSVASDGQDPSGDISREQMLEFIIFLLREGSRT